MHGGPQSAKNCVLPAADLRHKQTFSKESSPDQTAAPGSDRYQGDRGRSLGLSRIGFDLIQSTQWHIAILSGTIRIRTVNGAY